MTRRKFKVGDKVVTKKENGARPVGSVGKVVGYSNRLYKLEFDDYYMVYGYYTGSELDAFVEPKTTPKKEVKKAKPKFKVGDRVKIICTDDGARGAVIGDTGTIVGIHRWILPYTVKFDQTRSVYHTGSLRGFNYPDETCYHCSSKMLEKIEEPKNNTIVIYQKDRAVVAHDKATGQKCYAHCHPDDKFDFKTGAKIAFDRLMGRHRIVKQDKYKVGDKVKIVDEWCEGCVQNPFGKMDKYLGTIMTIKEVNPTGSYNMEDDNGRWYWYLNAIEGKVIEYPEEVKKEEPKYLEEFEKGKTYIFDKHIFERREGYCPSWATECHDKVVEVASSFHGEVSVFGISPCWCKETEYYFGKVVCVENSGANKNLYTVGKIYKIENGELISNTGSKIVGFACSPFKSVEELNKFSSSKFIEVVE